MTYESIRAEADRLLEATPDFETGGGQVTSPEGALRDMTVQQVEPNIVMFHNPNGMPPFKGPGWTMLYFVDTPAAAQALRKWEIEPPFFKQGSLSMRFGGYSMITDLWKKPKKQRYDEPGDYEKKLGQKHVVGALEAYVDEQGIFVDNLSVRPGWKRNTIGSKLMQALRNEWPDLEVTHSQETKEGGKFLKATGQYNPYREKETDKPPIKPLVPTVIDRREKEPTTEAILIQVLEDDDEQEEWIGVDLDGTLAKYTGFKGATKIGEPIPAMVKRIRRWVGHGQRVKIFTARADDEKAVNAIKKWLRDHELPDLEITNLKDKYMIELWDDRAVAVEKNTGKVKEAMTDQFFPYEEFIGEAEEAWEPSPYVINWFQNMLRMLTPQGIWTVPATGQVYSIDKVARTATLVQGDPNDPEGWHAKAKQVLQILGYTVHDSPEPPENPDEMAFAESVSLEKLKKHRQPLSAEEKAQIPKDLPEGDVATVIKAVLDDETWYACYTHRAYQAHKTLKGMLKSYPAIASTA